MFGLAVDLQSAKLKSVLALPTALLSAASLDRSPKPFAPTPLKCLTSAWASQLLAMPPDRMHAHAMAMLLWPDGASLPPGNLMKLRSSVLLRATALVLAAAGYSFSANFTRAQGPIQIREPAVKAAPAPFTAGPAFPLNAGTAAPLTLDGIVPRRWLGRAAFARAAVDRRGQ